MSGSSIPPQLPPSVPPRPAPAQDGRTRYMEPAVDVGGPRTVPVTRLTNRAGGIEGGMTNGEPVRVRVAMKPISTVPRALRTIDTVTGEEATAIHQRSDACAVPRAGVVVETMVALVLAQAALEKFGGDSLAETRRNVAGYLAGDPR